jgi:photosystem II stability/assembly factor-like uncharacterized protein
MIRWTVSLSLVASLASAQVSSPEERRQSWSKHVELEQTSIFKNLEWHAVGPAFMGGRVESIAVPSGSPSTVYVGVGAGNLWKTTNNGLTWKPIFEKESTFTVGVVAVAPSDPNVVWLGTGEVLMARSSFAGSGVFKSTDAGETWESMGLEDTHHIGRVLIHPEDPDVVYVAAVGHNYSFNDERGLFKTTDGGRNWEKILYVSEKVGVVDVFMDPERLETLYAISWERDRKAWNNVEAGEGSGIHKSTDSGKTWKRLTGGLPTGRYVGRSGLAIAPSRPNTLYAIVDNRTPVPGVEAEEESASDLSIAQLETMSRDDLLALEPEKLETILRLYRVSRKHTVETIRKSLADGTLEPASLVRHLRNLEETRRGRQRVVGGEIYRSDDRGDSWRKVHEDRLPTAIGYDFCLVRVSPDNPDEIYVLGNYLLHSTDGGRTYERNDGLLVHLLPHDSTVLHLDHHELWIDPDNADRLILGNDGGVHFSYDRGQSWLHVNNLPIGEFYAINLDMASPYNIYGGTQDDAAVFGPGTYQGRGGAADAWKHVYLDRWGGGDSYFTLVDPTDPDIIYYEHQFGRLRRKKMGDGSIVDIMPEAELGEPPLRYNWMSPFFISHYNPFTLYFGANRVFKSVDRGDSWRPISPDLATEPGPEKQGDVPFGTITSLSESILHQGLIYAGTDDGKVSITRNDGVGWTDVSEGLPSKWVSRVIASRHDRGTVYVSLTGYREDDFRTYVFSSDDFGKQWHSIAGNLPDEAVNVIREDPKNPEVLYVGTDLGVYVSLNGGKLWHSLTHHLPTTPVHDIQIHPRDREIVIGTHGRSIFVADAAPIQDLTADILSKKAHLFEVAPARLGLRRRGRGVWEHEPNTGAAIYYYTIESMSTSVTIRDETDNVLHRYEGTSDAGLNKVVWDLTLPAEAGQEDFVSPGEYRIEVMAGASRLEGRLRVRDGTEK